jgi:hypothetical protein
VGYHGEVTISVCDVGNDSSIFLYQLCYQKLNLAPGYICSLYQNNKFLIVETFCQKILHEHRHNTCAFVKFRKNPIFFMFFVKMRKFIL